MRHRAVIDLGFGDSGKGKTVDYLCSQSTKPLVVRFSGGHQVGHMVCHEDKNHVFSNFGSGTLRKVPTLWSRFCVVDPIGIVNELQILKDKGITPKLFISESCPVVTPFDKVNNWTKEDKNKHGSVGVGFGSTIEREENYYSLTFGDLFYKSVTQFKLDNIRKYYNLNSVYVNDFIEASEQIINSEFIKPVVNTFPLDIYEDIIYEGSQGLLLDQEFGFFPHVTRSNTGTKNIINHFPISTLELFLVIRAYQTRHGNGPMTNEDKDFEILKNPHEANKYNKYQGKFRRTMLDVSLLEYAIKKDRYIRHNTKTLVINCLDHLQTFQFTYNNEIVTCKDKLQFVETIGNILNVNKLMISDTAYPKFTRIDLT